MIQKQSYIEDEWHHLLFYLDIYSYYIYIIILTYQCIRDVYSLTREFFPIYNFVLFNSAFWVNIMNDPTNKNALANRTELKADIFWDYWSP